MDEICDELLEAIYNNGGKKTFNVARTSSYIWLCLMQMVADDVLVIDGGPDGLARTFRLKTQEQ